MTQNSALSPEAHAAAVKMAAAMPDGLEVAFALLGAFPQQLDQAPEALIEPFDRFHQVADEQLRELQRRHDTFALVALIDGLSRIATAYVDVQADQLKTSRQALLAQFRANLIAGRENREN
jgi:hypothetical protein